MRGRKLKIFMTFALGIQVFSVYRYKQSKDHQQQRRLRERELINIEQKVQSQKQKQSQELNQTQKDEPNHMKFREQREKIQVPLNSLINIKQLPEFPINDSIQSFKDENFIVLSDLEYNEAFQSQLIKYVKKVQSENPTMKINAYRLNVQTPEIKQILKQKFNSEIDDETIFFVKNGLKNQMVKINYMMYVQYPTLIPVFFKELNFLNDLNQLRTMSPHESYLLYVIDKQTEGQQKTHDRYNTAKFIQLELALKNYRNIELLVVDRSFINKNKLITDQQNRVSSLHLIRKKNQFTFMPPNLWLNNEKQAQLLPYHLVEDIVLFNKNGEVLLPKYSSKIETFDSPELYSQYVCKLKIDRNRINSETFYRLLETFASLKRNKQFPIKYLLSFGEIQYMGKEVTQNHEWNLKILNLGKMEQQTQLHQIQDLKALNNISIKEEDWLKNSFEYLYPSHSSDEEKIKQFIKDCLANKRPSHYQSQQKKPLLNVHKTTAQSFQDDILKDQNHHIVFEYVDHCPTCKIISPLIAELDKNIKLVNDPKLAKIHVLNASKNRVKENIYSPYSPSIYFYKKQWKKQGPVKLPLEQLMNIVDFCQITSQLKTVPWNDIERMIQKEKDRRLQFI